MEDELKDIHPKPSDSKWSIKSREILHTNPWNRFIHDKGETDTGKPYEYYFRDIGISAAAVALTKKGEMILVRQYRYVTNRESLEIPGGSASNTVDEKQLVLDELREETGYEGSFVQKIGEYDVANGITNDVAKLYLITGCTKVSDQSLDPSEEGLTVELYPVEEVYEMVQEGKITDGFTLAALMIAWPHLL